MNTLDITQLQKAVGVKMDFIDARREAELSIAGIMPKKLPVPMEGSSTLPPSKPMRRTMSHMASTVGGSV